MVEFYEILHLYLNARYDMLFVEGIYTVKLILTPDLSPGPSPTRRGESILPLPSKERGPGG